METLSTQYHQVFLKPRDEVGFKRVLTFDLYLGQVKGHRKISYKKMLGQGRKYLGMNEFCPSLPGTLQFVHSFVHFLCHFLS